MVLHNRLDLEDSCGICCQLGAVMSSHTLCERRTPRSVACIRVLLRESLQKVSTIGRNMESATATATANTSKLESVTEEVAVYNFHFHVHVHVHFHVWFLRNRIKIQKYRIDRVCCAYIAYIGSGGPYHAYCLYIWGIFCLCPNAGNYWLCKLDEIGANIDEIDSNYFNFFFESIWIMLNQIFRDFDQKNLNYFLGQTSPIFGANKYEKKAKFRLQISGLLTQIMGLWVQISIEFVQLIFQQLRVLEYFGIHGTQWYQK